MSARQSQADHRGDRRQLGRIVRHARTAAGLSVSRAAAQAGISRAAWDRVEAGNPGVHDYNFSKVERVLDWSAGSIHAYLEDGLSPAVVSVTEPGNGDDHGDGKVYVVELGDLSDEERAQVESLIELFRRRNRTDEG